MTVISIRQYRPCRNELANARQEYELAMQHRHRVLKAYCCHDLIRIEEYRAATERLDLARDRLLMLEMKAHD